MEGVAHGLTEQTGNPGQLWLVEPEHGVGNGELEEQLNREHSRKHDSDSREPAFP